MLHEATVVANHPLGQRQGLLELVAPQLARSARPGQFVMVQLRTPVPMLPRPMSLAAIDGRSGRVAMLYRVVGTGTELLAAASPGDQLRLLGPCGNGFSRPAGPALLVAGGTGLAPLLPVARDAPAGSRLLYGAGTAAELVDAGALAGPGIGVELATDDGSAGRGGTVLDLLPAVVEPGTEVYACGPRPMLAALARWARANGLKIWVSLEERMACGVGACLGCAVLTVDGYRRVCADGPVFAAEEVVWDEA